MKPHNVMIVIVYVNSTSYEFGLSINQLSMKPNLYLYTRNLVVANQVKSYSHLRLYPKNTNQITIGASQSPPLKSLMSSLEPIISEPT